MANNPLNLALRFILELVGLYAFALWGWTQHSVPWRYLWAALLPLAFASVWGVFRVPGDHGKVPVPVPGVVRLGIEALYFGSAVLAFYASGRETMAWVFGLVTLVHYLLSYDRVAWMVRRTVVR